MHGHVILNGGEGGEGGRAFRCVPSVLCFAQDICLCPPHISDPC